MVSVYTLIAYTLPCIGKIIYTIQMLAVYNRVYYSYN